MTCAAPRRSAVPWILIPSLNAETIKGVNIALLRQGCRVRSCHCHSLGRVARCILLFEGEPISGPRHVGTYLPISWHWCAVEQHLLDANMIVKPFEVAQSRNRACDVEMQRRRT